MPDYALKKISEFVAAATTPFLSGFMDIIDGGQNKKLALSQLREDILADAQLTGESTASTPNPGDDSNRVATTEFVQEELSTLGLNPATATEYGTVRTNSTVAVPVVYTKEESYSKAEVDAIDATTRPINKGGTGATTASGARANLGVAASGSNNDITQLSALASIPSIVQSPLASQDTRISILEGQNLNSRLTTAESVNSSQNSRLTSLESFQTSQTSLEGLVQGVWSGGTAPSNATSGQVITINRTSDSATLPGWTTAALNSNTIMTVPSAAGGTYEVNAVVRVGPFSGGTTPSRYKFAFMRQVNGGSTWVEQEFFGISCAQAINELWINGSVALTLSGGDSIRIYVQTNVTGGTVNIDSVRLWLRRVS